MFIATHNGPFHADDVVGVAIAQMWAVGRGYGTTIVRTTAEELSKYNAGIVLDVGQEYLVTKERFLLDHHQKNGVGAGFRPNGVPYAAAGLAWRHFGHELLWAVLPEVSEQEVEEAHCQIDKELIESIDLSDFSVAFTTSVGAIDPREQSPYRLQYGPTTVRSYTVADYINDLNPEPDSTADVDACFKHAILHVGATLIIKARRKAAQRFKVALSSKEE